MSTRVPLLSIVTPCRNAARHLARCLRSVREIARELPQGTIEHIIMDGGSTDGSVELIRAHADACPGLVTHWQSQADEGQSAAINDGFLRSRGAFGAWINADDWYEPRGLLNVMKHLEQSASFDVLVGRARIVDEFDRTIWSPVPAEPLSLASLMRLRSCWYAGKGILQPEAFFRLARFWEMGGLNVKNHHSMDHELWMGLAVAGDRFKSVDVLVASQLAHAGQKTADRVQTLRTLVARTRSAAASHRDRLGTEAESIEAELAAIERKIAVADAVLPVWRGQVSPRACADESVWPSDYEVVARSCLTSANETMRGKSKRRTLLLGLTAREISIVRNHPISDRCEFVEVDPKQVFPRADVAILGARVDRHASLQMGSLWFGANRKGLLVMLPAPVATPSHRAYREWLANRLIGNLAADHDTLLDQRVDSQLRAFAERNKQTEHDESLSCWGEQSQFAMQRTMKHARAIWVKQFGEPHEHPATPFEFIGPEHLRPDFTWIAGVWRCSRRLL